MEGLTWVLAGVGDEVAALTECLPAHDTLVRLFSCYYYYSYCLIISSMETFLLLDKLGIYTCCQKVFCEILWVLFYKNGSCQNLCCTHSPETHIWPKPFWYINNFTRTHTDCILHQQEAGISSLKNIGSVSQYFYRWILLMNLTCVNVSMLLHVRLLVKSFPAVLTGIWPSTRTI